MPDGIVIHEEEQVGCWNSINHLSLVIDFDSAEQREKFMDLATDNGLMLGLLTTPYIPEDEE